MTTIFMSSPFLVGLEESSIARMRRARIRRHASLEGGWPGSAT
jgi:hypothetical protein